MQKKQKPVFQVAIALPIYSLFDYSVPDEFNIQTVRPGCRLLVPFGKSKKTAYLVKLIFCENTDKLKCVEKVLDQTPLLSNQDLKLLHWASLYYHHPIGEVIASAFPNHLRQGKAAAIRQKKIYALSKQGETISSTTLKHAKIQHNIIKALKNEQRLSIQQLAALTESKQIQKSLQSLINKGLIKECEQLATNISHDNTESKHLLANEQQQQAITEICADLQKFRVILLEGVTGSGKTEVYMQIIDKILNQEQQVMVLLPEISLTPQLLRRFQKRFSVDIATFHSGLTAGERLNSWLSAQQNSSKILIGTRSAVFTPAHNLGLIIIDEEHDSSFKQQEGFRFSARDVAIKRARDCDIPVILGTATPSFESIENVYRKRYQQLLLTKRAGNALQPDFQLLDIRNKRLQEGFSDELLNAIKRKLLKNEQVLIFLNRRGYAPTLMCHACGWIAKCRSCDSNLVVHKKQYKLQCHHCGWFQPMFSNCPACKQTQLTPLGIGTERIEDYLKEIFPQEHLVRLDRDTTQKKGSLDKMLESIQNNDARLILGTQMLAKGHHFPNVTLVVLLDVDYSLYSIDFHAQEKLAQLIVQVAGRAGRAEKKGRVILQTRHPDHPLLLKMVHSGYRSFSDTAIKERKSSHLPPYSYQALLRISGIEHEYVTKYLENLQSVLQKNTQSQVQIFGPVPAPMMIRSGFYRYQILFQHEQRQILHSFLNYLVPQLAKTKGKHKIRWSLDVDPIDLY